MATQGSYVYDESFPASADLSALQFNAVSLGSTGVAAIAAATTRAIGVLQNIPKSGEAATVRMLGTTKAVADGSGTAIAAGDYVGPNASGVMVKKATADFNVAGIALDASTAATTVIRVFLTPGAFFRTAAG
jgi:hypothetical protein